MLVDKYEALQAIFKKAKELDLPVMTHCEDTEIINRNMQLAKQKWAMSYIIHASCSIFCRSIKYCIRCFF